MYPTFVIASVCLAETFTRIGGSFLKNKEICRETTTRGSGKMGLAYMALLAICCSWAYEGFRFNSSYKVDLSKTESFAQHYRHDFFRRTRIKHYIHRYNMADANPTRILAFKEGKGLAAVIFCCSDEFLKELVRLMPDKYLEF